MFGGGVIYHDVGERFNSPTKNLYFTIPDFLAFAENLVFCLGQTVSPLETENNYPVGYLLLPDHKTIQIHFVHYSSFSEAFEKWEIRKIRINPNNLFILLEMGLSTTEEYVKRFLNLPFENKMAFVNSNTAEKELFDLGIYDSNYHYGKAIEFDPKSLHMRRYLDRFDYIKWINRE